jgi:iron(III) transport system substrate-binding protein
MTGRSITRRHLLRVGGSGAIGFVGLTLAACSSPSGGGPNPASNATAATVATQAPTAAASATGEQALAAAARQEGMATLYSGFDPAVNDQLVAAMKDRYGVTLDVLRLAAGQLWTRFLAEAQADKIVADVMITGDELATQDAASKGLMARIDDLPAAAQWPKDFFKGTYALVIILPVVISWNTNLVPEGIKSWQDVIDPKWKDQVLLADPRSNNPVLGEYLFLKTTYGDDFLRKIAAQNPQLVDSTVPGTQQLAAGSVAVFFPNAHVSVAPVQSKGAPIADMYPNPTTGFGVPAAVTARAPHPNAARMLVNFCMTEDGQKVLSGAGGTTPLQNVAGLTTVPPGFTANDLTGAQAARTQLLDLLGIS